GDLSLLAGGFTKLHTPRSGTAFQAKAIQVSGATKRRAGGIGVSWVGPHIVNTLVRPNVLIV
ncbi:MAG: hypothetical protein V1754_04865, partial [Pseudomonadota bacterium]